MNQTEQILLQAVQKTLWNAPIEFPSDTDWGAVLKEAEKQTILGIVIGAAPEAIRQQWKSRTARITADFVRILHYQSEMCTLLKENGVPMVILKGTAAAVYYPDPLKRSMGDIDFLVPKEHFDRAKELLAKNGYTIEEDPKYPRHIDVCKDQIPFEMHRFFSDVSYDIEPYILDGLSYAETGRIFGSEFPMLPKLANGLVLLGHMANHLRTGLGLRQVIDWALYADKELDDAFWEKEFCDAAKKSGLWTVAVVATRMCQIYLGLTERITWCREADPDTCAMLVESLLVSGNFGKNHGAGMSVEKVAASLKKKGMFRYLQYAGEHNWEAYRRHKWLKPFCWIYQIGRYARQGTRLKRSGNQLREDFERGKQRSDLLNKLGL